MAEVKLAQLALRTSKDPTVTTKKMIDDHQSLLGEAKPIAMKAGVTPPDNLSMSSDAEYLKLQALSGDTFDKSTSRPW
jgi:predicted outer membrane protein